MRCLTRFERTQNSLHKTLHLSVTSDLKQTKCLECQAECDLRMVKGAASRNVNRILSKRRLCCILDRPYHGDFALLSHNESVILKMDSEIS